MQLTQSFVNPIFPAMCWVAEHPTAVRAALIVLSLLAALSLSLASSGAVFACSPSGGGGGCGG
jgi:hypothetical protein